MSTTMPTITTMTMTMGTITTVITTMTTAAMSTIITMGASMIIITPRMAAFITGKALPGFMFRA